LKCFFVYNCIVTLSLTKATKGAKGTKATKGAKGTKAAKGAKGTKGAKAVKAKMVNIKDLNKHQLLDMMVMGTEIVTMYWGLHQDINTPPKEELKKVDYYCGVKIGIDFRQDEVNSYIYNQHAGLNKLEKIVAVLRGEEEEREKKKKESELFVL
jgi:hypothetical protein